MVSIKPASVDVFEMLWTKERGTNSGPQSNGMELSQAATQSCCGVLGLVAQVDA
jgi:hypothetical protein